MDLYVLDVANEGHNTGRQAPPPEKCTPPKQSCQGQAWALRQVASTKQTVKRRGKKKDGDDCRLWFRYQTTASHWPDLDLNQIVFEENYKGITQNQVYIWSSYFMFNNGTMMRILLHIYEENWARIAQWWRISLACIRPCIQFPAPKRQINK